MDSTPPSSSPPTQKSPKKTMSWQGLRGNIPKYYLAMFIRNLWVSMPVGILYYMDRGLNFVQMAIIEVVIAAIIMVTDIPSGALADIFGRKLSTGIGLFMWGGSLILTAASKDFPIYILAGIIMGLGESLMSGADKALFYDTVKELGEEEIYLKYIGKKDLLGSISIIIAAISGAILYSVNISLPLYIHGAVNIIAGGIIFSMMEPTVSEHPKTIAAQYKLILNSLSFTWKSKTVRFFTIFSILVLVGVMGFVNIMEQPYISSIQVPVIYFGLIYAFTRGVIGFFAPLRYKIERRLGEKGSFYGVTLIFGVMFVLMSIIVHPTGLIFLFFLFFTRDYTWTIIDKYSNDHIPSDKRATVLSIQNFALNAVYMLAAVLIGWGLDSLQIFQLSTIQSVLIMLGLFCFVVLLPFLYTNYQTNGNNSQKAKTS
ncbi:MAG: MFS transporter [Promethearchaeota archaeon]